jgi:hypothetical protein
LSIDAALVERLYVKACAQRWRVPLERFAEALERGVERGANLETLHLDDLALACGCAAGDEEAWEHFIREQRPTLYRTADALDPGGGARDLADGIYGELFERSLFRYFPWTQQPRDLAPCRACATARRPVARRSKT